VSMAVVATSVVLLATFGCLYTLCPCAIAELVWNIMSAQSAPRTAYIRFIVFLLGGSKGGFLLQSSVAGIGVSVRGW